jgi:hypothetical protein
MTAAAIGYEIKLRRCRRVQHRLDRRTARIGNRSRRQAENAVGVIGMISFDIRVRQLAAENSLAIGDGGCLAAGQSLDHGRIGLQRHSALEAIDEHRRYARPFRSDPGFFLYD